MASFASAVNDWIKAEFLDKEPRLRASIVIPTQSPEMVINEIERLANDKRFVSVLMLVMDENLLEGGSIGTRGKDGLPICVHAGSTYKHPVTSVGWPSYYTEDYASNAAVKPSQYGIEFHLRGCFRKIFRPQNCLG